MDIEKLGAANPFAMAEIATGKSIDWATTPDPKGVIGKILGRPYEEIIDPRFGSPLYAGFALGDDQKFRRLDATEFVEIKDSAVAAGARFTNAALPRSLRELSVPQESKKAPTTASTEWTPSGATWKDSGRFFCEAAEMTDPQQGAVGNCYFVSALSSVAWTRPELLVHSTKPCGEEDEDFVCLIKFHQAPDKPIGGKNRATATVQVSEKVPLTTEGKFIYCRSSEPGEGWPSVYEKAYAKWLTENTTDKPDITKTANGSVAPRAVMQITGWQNVTSHAPRKMTNDELWSFVLAETNGSEQSNWGATRFPMVAGTVDTAAATVNGAAFSGDVVANHAYSVLGLSTIKGIRQIVLRNPWGKNIPSDLTNDAAGLVWNARVYTDWTQRVRLDRNGVFTIPLATFRNYYESIAVVRP